jgi:hypothetical protein
MSVQRLQAHWGFTRMPFGRSLAPSMLHRTTGTPRPWPASAGASTGTPSA